MDQREAGLKGDRRPEGWLGFHSQVAGGSLRWRVAGEGRGVRPARPRMTGAVIPTGGPEARWTRERQGSKGNRRPEDWLGFHSRVAGGSLRWRVAGEGRGVRPARPRMTGPVIPTQDRLGRHAVPTLPQDKRLTKGGQPYPWQLCRDAVPTLPMAEGA